MNDLIESLKIFSKYFKSDSYAPSHCEHDIFQLAVADKQDVMSDEDVVRIEELGWHWSREHECWCSFRFGSC